jgi:hypothetical protein
LRNPTSRRCRRPDGSFKIQHQRAAPWPDKIKDRAARQPVAPPALKLAARLPLRTQEVYPTYPSETAWSFEMTLSVRHKLGLLAALSVLGITTLGVISHREVASVYSAAS